MTQSKYLEFDKRADELLSKMTLRQKIGQLNQIKTQRTAEELEEIKELIKRGEVGSFILASTATAGIDNEYDTSAAETNRLQKLVLETSPVPIPALFGRDVIHGHHTVFPIPLAYACSFNPELVKRCCRAIAKEASASGVQWTFAPMLDICHDPRWGRIVEGPGEDPYLGAQLARAAVSGFQGDDLTAEDSLIACAKHFLGYGYSEGGRDYNRTEISDYTLYNYVLPAFRAAIEEGVATVMSSFNDINGVPVSAGKHYLTDILRDKLGFEGFVVSDWAAVSQLVDHGVAEGRRDCAKPALTAGIDMDMVDFIYVDFLEELVKSGELEEKYIDLAAKRILRVKLAKGLFEQPYVTAKAPDRAEHIRLARELACESMVLLKNDGALPLRPDSKILLGGDFKDDIRTYLGTWMLDGIESDTATLTEAIKDALSGGELHIAGDSITKCEAALCDTIVLALGESYKVTGEATALASISLTDKQVALAKCAHESGKRVVGIIFGGRPLALEAVEPYLDAILYAWHSGTETAHAVCDILFGKFNPCAKSAVTFLKTTGHIPLYYNATSGPRPINSYYGSFLHSYCDNPAVPMYPFGYGLSYSKFTVSQISTDRTEISYGDVMAGEKIRLSVTVKNEGELGGKEVVQLYVRDVTASMMRPLRELKAFKKEYFDAGECKTLTFEIGKEELGFYGKDGDYIVECGRFEIYIGSDCLTENKADIFIV